MPELPTPSQHGKHASVPVTVHLLPPARHGAAADVQFGDFLSISRHGEGHTNANEPQISRVQRLLEVLTIIPTFVQVLHGLS